MGISFHTRSIASYGKHTKLVIWFIGIVGIALATGAMTSRGIHRATDAVTTATLTPSVSAAADQSQVIANISQSHDDGLNDSGSDPATSASEDHTQPGVSVNVSVSKDSDPEINVNGQDIEAPESGHVRQTVTSSNGIAHVDVTTNDNTNSSTGDKNRSSTSTSLRINSSTTTRQRTSTSH